LVNDRRFCLATLPTIKLNPSPDLLGAPNARKY
jgi:hypothetical protein